MRKQSDKTGSGLFEFPDVDPLSSAAFGAFMSAMHIHRQVMAKLFAERGGHMGQAVCLRVLDAHDGISQRDLADILHLSRPTVTTMLQALEKGGVIVRKTDETDQRLTRVYLTDEGRQRAGELRAVIAAHINQTFGKMTADDRREIARLLGVLSENAARTLPTTAATSEEEPAR